MIPIRIRFFFTNIILDFRLFSSYRSTKTWTLDVTTIMEFLFLEDLELHFNPIPTQFLERLKSISLLWFTQYQACLSLYEVLVCVVKNDFTYKTSYLKK